MDKSDMPTDQPSVPGHSQPLAPTGRLSRLDKYLPLWIGLAMVFGLLLGRLVPNLKQFFDAVRVGSVSLPIALGLLWMMYPVLAKVQYEKLHESFRDWKLFGVSLALNWIIGPLLMFGLAWLFLAHYQGYREGVIMVGLARCIAMVLIWNMLAGGDPEKAAILVALNSIFQILMYSPYAYLFIGSAQVTMWEIARSVFVFLGIPLIAGMLTRFYFLRKRGRQWFESVLIPKLGPTAIFGLLFTIVVMFAMQGDKILAEPLDVLLIAAPLIAYFLIMFAVSFVGSWFLRFPYPQTVSLSFTAASNNFELAIAVAIATYGIQSDAALATVVGPLIEVPVLLLLVYVALWLRPIMWKKRGHTAL